MLGTAPFVCVLSAVGYRHKAVVMRVGCDILAEAEAFWQRFRVRQFLSFLGDILSFWTLQILVCCSSLAQKKETIARKPEQKIKAIPKFLPLDNFGI